MRFLATLALLAAVLATGCTELRLYNRHFLTSCPENGPNPEQELGVFLEPVDLPEHLQRLRGAADGFSLRVIAEVADGEQTWPIYHASRPAPGGTRRLLVVAGIHGNEVAATLAAPDILSDVRAHSEVYERLDLHLIAPANPVGLRHGARYNAHGCDINRDFSAFETIEARAVRDVITETKPELVLSLHEGPHDGFFVIATRDTPPSLATTVAAALQASGVELATHSNLGSQLSIPGVMQEGWFLSGVKKLFRIRSLGAYLARDATPLLTTEGPWRSTDVAARVRAQVLTVRAVADALAAGAVDE